MFKQLLCFFVCLFVCLSLSLMDKQAARHDHTSGIELLANRLCQRAISAVKIRAGDFGILQRSFKVNVAGAKVVHPVKSRAQINARALKFGVNLEIFPNAAVRTFHSPLPFVMGQEIYANRVCFVLQVRQRAAEKGAVVNVVTVGDDNIVTSREIMRFKRCIVMGDFGEFVCLDSNRNF